MTATPAKTTRPFPKNILTNLLRRMFPPPPPPMETGWVADDLTQVTLDILYFAAVGSVVTAAAALGGWLVISESLRFGGLPEALAHYIANFLWQTCAGAGVGETCAGDLSYLLGGLVFAIMFIVVIYFVLSRGTDAVLPRKQALIHEHLQMIEEKLRVIYDSMYWMHSESGSPNDEQQPAP